MAEKEYVLGNKTKDLLVYTFTVTKPIGDKTMDINEVVKILRSIKELPEAEREAFIIEVIDSMSKTSSKQGFPKSAVYTYAKTIRETAVLILRNIHAANGKMFVTEYEERLRLINEVLDDCSLLLEYIQICVDNGYVSIERSGIWTKKLRDVQYMTMSWRKNDGARAKKLREEAEAAKDQRQVSLVKEAIRQVKAGN